ncbi:MAG TPA: DUF2652 domain-containing protein [Candidatus Limnocylindrales bacterium]|nr:DUF2652 domain-containing protein [Candidatus Limnocylindrales bacterium]
MINRPEPACLLIADIAGYTGYLAGVELDHAQDILADLVDTVVGGLRPTFRLAKLEGDAAFAYSLTESLDGSAVQDTVETTYFAFRRRLRDIGQASQCECDACIRIPDLDLKFVVHHGLVVRQRVAGREELVGRDVILVHRLLKNGVEATTGVRAYSIYTGACVAAMGIDPRAHELAAHEEQTDLGTVECWLRDLDAAWLAEQERTRLEVAAADAYDIVATDVPAPPALAWEFVTSPARRPQWGPGINAIVELTGTRRRGAGTTNHCMHGKDAIFEEVLDWRPFEYWTTRTTMPVPGAPKLTMTDAFIPLPGGGTRIETRIGQPKPREREAFAHLYPMVRPMVTESATALARALEVEMARRAAETEAGTLDPEPPVPTGSARFATEPIRSARGTVDSGSGRSSYS